MPSPAEHLAPERLGAAALEEDEAAHVLACARCRVDRRRLADFDRELAVVEEPLPGAVALEVGTVVDGKYVVGSVLGRGGMGTVYAVRHVKLGSMHAMKLMNLPDPVLAERLLREGQLQAGLEHTNIVRVTDVVAIGDVPGLVMEYIRGPSLADLIHDGGLRTWELRDRLALGILRGVRAAHRQGWVHRDLKPANILLAREDGDFVPKIADFGLARLVQDAGLALTRPGMVLGTPFYMAPEQFDDASSVGAQADVFALGAILYEMCTGQRPFQGQTLREAGWAVTTGRYIPPRQLAPDLPDRMEQAIVGALQVDRRVRFAGVKELMDAWRGAGSGDSSEEGNSSSLDVSGAPRQIVPSGERAGATISAELMGSSQRSDPPSLESLAGLTPSQQTRRRASFRRAWFAGGAALLLAVAAVGTRPLWSPPPADVPPAPSTTASASAPVSAPAPAPTADPVSGIASPAPDPRSAPAPSGTPKPAPFQRKPPPAPEPLPPVDVTGTVVVTGDARRVELVAGQARFGPGAVPPGHYRVVAEFPDYGEISDTEFDVAAGQRRVVNCVAAFTRCDVR